MNGPRSDHTADEPAAVRPFALVAGRASVPGAAALALESVVRAVLAPAATGLSAPERRIVALVEDRYESIAELSAHLALPLGTVRVLVADLAARGCVTVHGADGTATAPVGPVPDGVPSHDPSLLGSLLDGIAHL